MNASKTLYLGAEYLLRKITFISPAATIKMSVPHESPGSCVVLLSEQVTLRLLRNESRQVLSSTLMGYLVRRRYFHIECFIALFVMSADRRSMLVWAKIFFPLANHYWLFLVSENLK